MKKFLFLVVPTTLTYFPEMAIPSLTAQLRSKSYNVSVMDLNIDFFHHIYNRQYLEKSLENAKVQYEELKARKETFYNNQDIYENQILINELLKEIYGKTFYFYAITDEKFKDLRREFIDKRNSTNFLQLVLF